MITFTPEPAFLKRVAEPFTITPNDIGRKCVSQFGETWTVIGPSEDPDYDFSLMDSEGDKYDFTKEGKFWAGDPYGGDSNDLVKWLDTPDIPTNHPDASEAKNQRDVLIRALRNGERLTVLSAMKQYGVYALSQRVGEIIKSGVDVKKDWLDLPNNKRVRVYFMEGV